MGCSTDLFQNFRRLRALTLKNSVELSNTIDNLIHIRYLNLVDYYGKLPETICNMCKLYFFKITWLNIFEYIESP